MVGGRTCSAWASAPSVIGPPKTMTESAESCGAGRAGRVVLAAQAAEQMDRGGVQPVGEVGGPERGRSGGGAIPSCGSSGHVRYCYLAKLTN